MTYPEMLLLTYITSTILRLVIFRTEVLLTTLEGAIVALVWVGAPYMAVYVLWIALVGELLLWVSNLRGQPL